MGLEGASIELLAALFQVRHQGKDPQSCRRPYLVVRPNPQSAKWRHHNRRETKTTPHLRECCIASGSVVLVSDVFFSVFVLGFE